MAQTCTAFARYADSEASAIGIVNGDPSRPVGLAEVGREQSRKLGGGLGGQDLSLRVVIECPRTRQTADFALADRDVPRLMLCELNDRPFGSFESKPIAELSDWLTRPSPGEPLGGESCVRAVLRYARGLPMIGGGSRAAGRCDRAQSPGDLHGAGV
jgi:broad specificity phosphatase PhoE